MSRRTAALLVSAVVATATASIVLINSPAQAAGNAGTFVSVAPTRVLDTRSSLGGTVLGPLGTLHLQVTGSTVPVGASAVMLNVTVTQPTSGGFITVWGDGTARPSASSLNFLPGQTAANSVVAPIGAGGVVDFFNGSPGSSQLIADVSGYFTGGTASDPGTLVPVTPTRLLDTRSGVGGSALGPLGKLTLQVTGGVIPAGAAAVVLNVTTAQPSAGGYITAWADGDQQPVVSNLNFVAGQTIPNLVIAPVSSAGKVDLFNGSPGTTQLLADVAGYFIPGTATDAGAYVKVTPTRLLDTRSSTGGVTPGVNGTVSVQAAGTAPLPATGMSAVVLNVTAAAPTGSGWITAWADGTTLPVASNLNFTPGQTVPNLTVTPLGTDGRANLYNGSPGSTQLLADVSGYFIGSPAKSWAPVSATLPGDASSDPTSALDAVSCAAAGSCAAVGGYNDAGSVFQSLLATSIGGVWTTAETVVPNGSGSEPYLQSVSCGAVGSCVAVGGYTKLNPYTVPLIETYSGGTWTSSDLALPADAVDPAQGYLDAVSCASATACVAVGYYFTATSQAGLIATLSGTTWTTTAAPLPSGGNSSTSNPLFSVSCTAATACVAVGEVNIGGTNAPFAETLSGTTWSGVEVPTASSDTAYFNAVKCASAGTCAAYGTYENTPNSSVLAVLSGGSWSSVNAPGVLKAVDCASATACVAVGSAVDGNGTSTQPLIERWSGVTWTASNPALPTDAANAPAPILWSVACPAAGTCTGVGSYQTNTGAWLPLIENLSAGTFSTLAAPLPAGASHTSTQNSDLFDVACPAVDACVSVGDYNDTSAHSLPLINVLSGS